MICPACGGGLEKHAHGYVLFGCTMCGGVLADTATAKMVHDGIRKHLLAAAAGNIETDATRSEGPPEGARRCPTCQGAMAVDVWRGVNVDVCEAHGVWFDRGELGAVAMRLRSSGGDRAVLDISKSNSRHVPSWARVGGAAAAAGAAAGVGISEGAGDALDLGFDVLGALLD